MTWNANKDEQGRDHEVDGGCVIDRGALRASVMIRAKPAKGDVNAVGCIFAKSYATQVEAIELALSFSPSERGSA